MSDPASTPKVTGGMGGIGQGIVIALTQRDFDVVVGDQTIDPAIAERVTNNAAPGARLSFSNDLTDPGDLPRFADAIFTAFFGHIDCLVNNAGLPAKSQGHLFDVSAESYDLDFAVNASGAFFLAQAVCKKMLAAEGYFPESARSVVFISSSNAVIAAPERGGVCDVQSDGRQAAKLFAIRLAPNGIAAYEVPAQSYTPMTDVAQSRFDMLLVEGFTLSTAGAGPRMSDARSRPMAAGELHFTTGTAIQVDGGMHIHQY